MKRHPPRHKYLACLFGLPRERDDVQDVLWRLILAGEISWTRSSAITITHNGREWTA